MTEKEFKQQLDRDTQNSEVLNEKWYEPIRNFMMQHVNESWGEVRMLDLFAVLMKTKRPSKSLLLEVCSKFYFNTKIMNDYYHSLSKEEQQIIEKATWTGFVSYKDLNKIFGREVIYAQTQRNSSHPRYSLFKDKILQRWFSFLSYSTPWNSKSQESYLQECDPKLTFSRLMRQIYAEILPKPAGYYLKRASKPAKVSYFSAENNIFRELPLIIAYYYQDNMKYTQKGYPNIASAKKMTKSLQLKKFPSENETGLRAILISGLFSEGLELSSPSITPLSILRELFKTDFNDFSAVPYLLPHLRGIYNIYPQEFSTDISTDLFRAFREMPLGEWVTFENLLTYSKSHFFNLRLMSYYAIDKLSPALDLKHPASGFGRKNVEQYIGIPAIAGYIYLLAAFGLMEIAVNEKASFRYSYYDGLQAFKLTGLGAYILGLKNTYTPPESENETQFLFDENAPVIRIEGNLILGDTLLDKFAVKMSENRYQFSPNKFLKDCKTTDDLRMKIALFKQSIGKKLPGYWERYLEGMLQKTKDIKMQNKLVVFKLSPDNKELHRLIAQDEILRLTAIKGEKYHIIIEKGNINSFIKRMKDFGYMIDFTTNLIQ